MKKSILIVGGNSHLAKYLRKSLQKYQLFLLTRTALTNLNETTEKNIVCDMLDCDAVREHLAGMCFDIIINCVSQQPRKGAEFVDYLNGNVQTLNNLLSTIEKPESTLVIHFSSAVVYGEVAGIKLDENSPLAPTNDYALTKLMAEQVLLCRQKQNKFTAYCLRLPSLFGAEQIGGLVDTYRKILQQDDDLEIFSQGKLIRNIMHFSDVARAVNLIAEKPLSRSFNLYLLGSKDSLSMNRIAELLASKLNSRSQLKLVSTKATVEVDWDFDLSKVITDIDFKPSTTSESLDRYLEESRHVKV